MMVINQLKIFLSKEQSILPLVVLRVCFGLLMFASSIRFFIYGWIDTLYVKPSYSFKFYGFEWINVWPEWGMNLHLAVLAILALFIVFGFFYRVSTTSYFILFTYLELMDKTYYLNHYYFISLLSLLICFIPAHHFFSLDVYYNRVKKSETVSHIYIFITQLQLAIVYFFAGLAKLNYDWLVLAQPMTTWLKSMTDFPIIGTMFKENWCAYFFSYFGAIYDLSIPFLLWYKHTRFVSYLAVIVFHIFTWSLFQIGMFPWIMIYCTLIFFSSDEIGVVLKKIRVFQTNKNNDAFITRKQPIPRSFYIVISIYFIFQILIPMRYLLYPGNVLWSEQGFRFSWRVMLVEKMGHVDFIVKSDTKTWHISPSEYLTPFQERQMSTQPDMILEFAHFLKSKFKEPNIRIYANAYVALNGRASRQLIDPTFNLLSARKSFTNKGWILPFEK